MPIRQDHPQGTTVLILGILSFAFCQLAGPVVWSMGNKALREIDADPNRYANRGAVVTGRILGIVASVVLMVAAAFFVLVIVIAILGEASSSNFDGEPRPPGRVVWVVPAN